MPSAYEGLIAGCFVFSVAAFVISIIALLRVERSRAERVSRQLHELASPVPQAQKGATDKAQGAVRQGQEAISPEPDLAPNLLGHTQAALKESEDSARRVAAEGNGEEVLASGPPIGSSPEFLALREHAQTGDAESQYQLGQMYAEGMHCRQDNSAAFGWYRRAAKQDHPDANFALGMMYREGRVVPLSLELSDRYLRKAALLGSAEAQALIDTSASSAPATIATPERSDASPELAPGATDRPAQSQKRFPIAHTAHRFAISKPKTRPNYHRTNAPIDSATEEWFYKIGRRKGLLCAQRAQLVLSRKLAAGRVEDGPHSVFDREDLYETACRIASRRGYLAADSDAGMEEELDGADPLFDECREAFIAGVKDGLRSGIFSTG